MSLGKNKERVAWDFICVNGIDLLILTDEMPEGLAIGYKFETMVFRALKNGEPDFNKPFDEYTNRYQTKEDALIGHGELVSKLYDLAIREGE